jgi:glucose-6-phosphate isomerase
MDEELPTLRRFVAECREAGLTDAVLLGMGGSSLAPEVFRRSQAASADALRLHVLDTTEPATIAAVADSLDLAKTLFVVSSKSGGTIETRTQYEFFHDRQPDGGHFVAITDPGSELESIARESGFRRVFPGDPEIGGRYSALSYFGLVPAVLMGVDLEAVLDGAEVAEQTCSDFRRPDANSGVWLGATLGELALRGVDKLTLVVDEPISAFGLWAEQLVAESTGKQGRGILPIADEPLGAPDAYGRDRVFVHLRNEAAPDSGHDEAIAALAKAGHSTITLQARGPGDLGRVFFFAEFATAVAGWALQINPFDQPNVQEAKDNTQKALSGGVSGLADASDDALRALVAGLEPPKYLAILGYLPYAAEVDEAVGRLRAFVRDRRGVATTYGYGPRYLHSTGQLHKGGPPTGVFLQLVHDGTDDLPIPGRDFGFRRLIDAQADGDLQTLRDHGLPAERVRLRAAGLGASLDELTARLSGML